MNYICPHGINVATQQCHDCARDGYAKSQPDSTPALPPLSARATQEFIFGKSDLAFAESDDHLAKLADQCIEDRNKLRAEVAELKAKLASAENWTRDWHAVVATLLTVNGLSPALGATEALHELAKLATPPEASQPNPVEAEER